MSKEQELYLSIGRAIEGAEESQMFGKPCFKVNTKAFISLFDEEMVFKLTGSAHKEASALTGARAFDPSKKGRPMKEWVQVPYTHKAKWPKLAQNAFEFVRQLSEK